MTKIQLFLFIGHTINNLRQKKNEAIASFSLSTTLT